MSGYIICLSVEIWEVVPNYSSKEVVYTSQLLSTKSFSCKLYFDRLYLIIYNRIEYCLNQS